MARPQPNCPGLMPLSWPYGHQAYLDLEPDGVVEMIGGPAAVVDCFGMLDDAAIKRYFELGCEVKGLGRGHIKRIKDAVRASA